MAIYLGTWAYIYIAENLKKCMGLPVQREEKIGNDADDRVE